MELRRCWHGTTRGESSSCLSLLALLTTSRRQDTSVLNFVAYCEGFIAEGSPDVLMVSLLSHSSSKS